MGRIRTVKPEIFLHEELYDLERETNQPVRLGYIGLWTQCDREGRFKWSPRRLKTQIFPYDNLDFARVLDALATRSFVVRYRDTGGSEYGYIPAFLEHQYINNKEKESTLPDPDKCNIVSSLTREERDDDATSTRGVKDNRIMDNKRLNTNPSFEPKAVPKSTKRGRKLKTKKGLVQDEDLINEMQNCFESLGPNHQKEFYENAMTLRTDGKPCPAEGSEYETKLLCDYFKDFYRKSDWHKAVLSGSNKSLGGSL